MRNLICGIARLILWLRYRVKVEGLEEVCAKGTTGVLLLPTHPALIDPVIQMSRIYPRLRYHALADEDQMERPIINRIAKMFGVIRVPSAVKRGRSSVDGVAAALDECARLLASGENVMIYPAGHILRQQAEEVGGNSAVEKMLQAAPEARVVLVKVRGLWGSAFSRADGGYPNGPEIFKKALKALPANLLFFMPRRHVFIKIWEPEDFPRGKDRTVINQYIERNFNEDLPQNTYVPYYFRERGGIRTLPEPESRKGDFDPEMVSETIRRMVEDKVADLAGGRKIEPGQRLAADLGMDSLTRLELLVWIEQEFGFNVPNPDAFETVADVFAAANGQVLADKATPLTAVSRKWFNTVPDGDSKDISLPEAANIAEAFLKTARSNPDRPVIADQTAGVKTYRDIVLALLVLKPFIAAMPGERLGIMLPASATAGIVYLAALFAGKTPVMVNWTVGERNINYLVELMGISTVVTAKRLVDKVKEQGTNFGKAAETFCYLEELAAGIGLPVKLRAKVLSRFSWRDLDPAVCPETAVVLFTSGSESLPKAVPLTHNNILTNIGDVLYMRALRKDDVMIGMLPPFHSFGISLTLILPLLTGIRTVYHPNPTEGGTLARLINMYKASVLPGTPTFINGILKAALPADLASLRLGVTGAEKCPEYVYNELKELCPDVMILEGYGITECSPVVAVNYPDNPVPFSIGRIVRSLKHMIVKGEDMQRCGVNEQGMLLVSGPSVFPGYLEYDGPSPFVTIDDSKYYRTGDLVVEDENGTIFFRGRLKRFIKLGGEMISMPAVEEVLVDKFRKPDDDGPVLAVEAPGGDNPELTLFTVRDISREEANDAIRAAGLSALHNIRRVEKIDEVPLLGTGKTDYRSLLKMFE